ncbi:MerR family transcriptional regulator [Thermodesulfobacteriota bacterium B35]
MFTPGAGKVDRPVSANDPQLYSKGLLPGAQTRGRNAYYTDAQLDRLRCIQYSR